MANVIPSDTHGVGDPAHTTDHNNISDVLGLIAQTLAILAGYAPGTVPSSNAANVAAMQAGVAAWSGYNSSSYEFYPEAYGAYGDGQLVTDGAMTSGSPTLTCATSAPFVSSDVGKWVNVGAAGGGAYSPLCAQISGYTSSSVVTLSANATSSISSAVVMFGHDDTAAINAAVTAAYVAWGNNKRLLPSILFSQKMYCLGGTASPVNKTSPTGAGQGNALIPLPIVPVAGEKLTLVFQGVPDSTGLLHWNQTIPQFSGAAIVCLRTDGTNDATFGQSAVIGGPINGFGGGNNTLFSNMLVVVDGIEVIVPYNSTYGGFDFWGVGEANITNAATMAAGVVGATGPFPSIGDPTHITNTWAFGLRMPSAGNNDDAYVGLFACEGLTIGIQTNEHTYAASLRLIYCVTAIMIAQTSGLHSALIAYASVEASTNVLGCTDGGRIDVEVLDYELPAGGVFLNDFFNLAQGNIGFRGTPGGHAYGSLQSGGTGFQLIDLDRTPGPVASPQAATASAGVWHNYYYRDAWITLQATTITALSIDSTAQKIPPPTLTTVSFLLPSGHAYTWTGTGSAAHTVCLI